MRGILAAVTLGSIAFSSGAQDQSKDPKARASWMGVFPNIQGYQASFHKPEIKSEKPPVWSQKVRYDWTGGRLEAVEITLARDGNFAKLYDPKAITKGNDPAKELKIGKHAAFQWGKAKLVVVLGADRIVKVDSATPKDFDSDLKGFAEKLPLEKIAEALDKPPRTDFKRNLNDFHQLKKGMSLDEVRDWVGDADKDIGSGIHIMVYGLDSGGRILIGFPDFRRLIYVKHDDGKGKTEDLLKYGHALRPLVFVLVFPFLLQLFVSRVVHQVSLAERANQPAVVFFFHHERE